jgi:hypothetical protein
MEAPWGKGEYFLPQSLRAALLTDDLISVSLTFRPNPPQRPLPTEHADKKAREPEHNSHVIISKQNFQEKRSNLTYLYTKLPAGTRLISQTITLHVKLKAH